MLPLARARQQERTFGDIGLELSLEAIHMLQLCRHGESLQVNAHAAIDYPGRSAELIDNAKQFAQLVKQGLKQGNFSGRRVVAAMPASVTQVMPVSYQSSSDQDDDAAIGFLPTDGH